MISLYFITYFYENKMMTEKTFYEFSGTASFYKALSRHNRIGKAKSGGRVRSIGSESEQILIIENILKPHRKWPLLSDILQLQHNIIILAALHICHGKIQPLHVFFPYTEAVIIRS